MRPTVTSLPLMDLMCSRCWFCRTWALESLLDLSQTDLQKQCPPTPARKWPEWIACVESDEMARLSAQGCIWCTSQWRLCRATMTVAKKLSRKTNFARAHQKRGSVTKQLCNLSDDVRYDVGHRRRNGQIFCGYLIGQSYSLWSVTSLFGVQRNVRGLINGKETSGI